MSRTTIGVGITLVFVVTLVATAPARLLNAVMPADQLLCQGFGGTVWRGSAGRCLVGVGSGYIHLGQVNWSLNPWSLLSFSPELDIDSSWGRQRLAATVRATGPENIELSEVEAVASARLLRQFLPLTISGDLSAQFDVLQLQNGLPLTAKGRVAWREGAWESAQGLLPLGSYVVDIEPAGNGVLAGKLITLEGDVNATGSLTLAGRKYALDILVSGSRGELDGQLKQALSLIAQALPEGYRVKFDGQFLAM